MSGAALPPRLRLSSELGRTVGTVKYLRSAVATAKLPLVRRPHLAAKSRHRGEISHRENQFLFVIISFRFRLSSSNSLVHLLEADITVIRPSGAAWCDGNLSQRCVALSFSHVYQWRTMKGLIDEWGSCFRGSSNVLPSEAAGAGGPDVSSPGSQRGAVGMLCAGCRRLTSWYHTQRSTCGEMWPATATHVYQRPCKCQRRNCCGYSVRHAAVNVEPK